MRLSITITDYNWTAEGVALPTALRNVVRAADESSIDTVWVADHLLQSAPGTVPTDPYLEAYATLGFLAAASERVRLGTLVTAATFRQPALLVKAVTTVDLLSGGRMWFGIGAGYDQGEASALGLPLPPAPERFERPAETVHLARQMWAGDSRPFTGRHYRLEQPISSPPPVHPPGPPVLIGGTGERRTLRLVAELADACNLFDIPDGGRTVRHKLEVLARHCAEVGRSYPEIEKTVSTRVTGGEDAGSLVERCRTLAGYGIDHAIVLTDGPWAEPALATVASAAEMLA